MKSFIYRAKGIILSLLLLCISLTILVFCFFGVKNIMNTVTYKKTPIYIIEIANKK